MTTAADSVAVGYCDGGEVSHHFVGSLVDLLVEDHFRENPRILDKGGHISVMSGPRIAQARNDIVRHFLERTQAGWLLMVDTDMVFTPENLDQLLDAASPEQRPIVGGLCFAGLGGQMYPTMYRLVKPTEDHPQPIETIMDFPEDALVKVSATGAAFLLMPRDALVKIGKAYESTTYPWFMEGTVYKGLAFGEDWAFSMRAAEQGFPTYVHTGCHIGHVKPMVMEINGYRAYQQRRAEMSEALPKVTKPQLVVPNRAARRAAK